MVAHGTVERVEQLPDFVREIRRGRPAPPELIEELTARYERIGQSPLLGWTYRQAEALSREAGLPTRVAMRLWDPRVPDVLADLGPHDHVCLVPVAPFSVHVYEAAARRAMQGKAEAPQLTCVEPWGEDEELIDAWADGIRTAWGGRPADEDHALILTAHSLPRAVIERGDPYAEQFERAARKVGNRVGGSWTVAYQSQGASDDAWLGPTLLDEMRGCREQGIRRVTVAPIGFLAEHVETLFDLDVEAAEQAGDLGLEFVRVPALGTGPGLIRAMSKAAKAAIVKFDT